MLNSLPSFGKCNWSPRAEAEKSKNKSIKTLLVSVDRSKASRDGLIKGEKTPVLALSGKLKLGHQNQYFCEVL